MHVTPSPNCTFSHLTHLKGLPTVLLSENVGFLHYEGTLGFNVFVFLSLGIQIARKRHKVITTFRSPLGQTRPPAQLKHIALMPLSQIRRVLDIQDSEGES